ncbi:hypothetical protein [Nostoc sp.]|uniref:hypothetical protein n=1 Tax=Nostoc sp. TaxID=1180 RepID=UPI002FF5588D
MLRITYTFIQLDLLHKSKIKNPTPHLSKANAPGVGGGVLWTFARGLLSDRLNVTLEDGFPAITKL